MQNLQIQPATQLDQLFLIQMLELAMQSLPHLAARSQIELDGMARLELGRWQPGRDYAFVARLNGQPAGAVWLRQEGETTGPQFNLGLAVSPPHQRQGVGRVLLKHALDFCRLQKAHSVNLKVHPANQGAVQLYQQLGFEITLLEMKHKL